MPDASQCGYVDGSVTPTPDPVDCDLTVAAGLQASRGKGFELRITVLEAGGIRKEIAVA